MPLPISFFTKFVRFVALGCASLAAAAVAGEPFPLPGLYQVEMANNHVARAGEITVESATRVQGSTGNSEMTQRGTGRAPMTVGPFQGKGQMTTCFKPTNDPAAAYAAVKASGCKSNRTKVDGDTMTFDMTCPTTTQQVHSRRIDERTWELRIDTQSLASNAANATPAPDAVATNPVSAQLVAKMEEQIRKNPNSADAAVIRQQISALRSGAGSWTPGVSNSSILIYTKTADTCS
jgi:Protein of unknown function (DUF3617)